MDQFKTFWDIVKNQGIEVPPIQRDYAQGREIKKVETIRKKFINAIFKALKTNSPLRLDFIYGKIYGIRNEAEHMRNKQAINALLKSVKDKSPNKEDLVNFIPLDGQQRLTTLFLVHWYIIKRLNLNDSLDILIRFKYKTRKSSLAFINLICSEIEINFEDSIEENIKRLENFSNTWLNDPTVNSMLVVLREIHENFRTESKEEIRTYWE